MGGVTRFLNRVLFLNRYFRETLATLASARPSSALLARNGRAKIWPSPSALTPQRHQADVPYALLLKNQHPDTILVSVVFFNKVYAICMFFLQKATSRYHFRNLPIRRGNETICVFVEKTTSDYHFRNLPIRPLLQQVLCHMQLLACTPVCLYNTN